VVLICSSLIEFLSWLLSAFEGIWVLAVLFVRDFISFPSFSGIIEYKDGSRRSWAGNVGLIKFRFEIYKHLLTTGFTALRLLLCS